MIPVSRGVVAGTKAKLGSLILCTMSNVVENSKHSEGTKKGKGSNRPPFKVNKKLQDEFIKWLTWDDEP